MNKKIRPFMLAGWCTELVLTLISFFIVLDRLIVYINTNDLAAYVIGIIVLTILLFVIILHFTQCNITDETFKHRLSLFVLSAIYNIIVGIFLIVSFFIVEIPATIIITGALMILATVLIFIECVREK